MAPRNSSKGQEETVHDRNCDCQTLKTNLLVHPVKLEVQFYDCFRAMEQSNGHVQVKQNPVIGGCGVRFIFYYFFSFYV